MSYAREVAVLNRNASCFVAETGRVVLPIRTGFQDARTPIILILYAGFIFTIRRYPFIVEDIEHVLCTYFIGIIGICLPDSNTGYIARYEYIRSLIL